MRRLALLSSCFIIVLSALSCKGTESAYVTVVFKYFEESSGSFAVASSPVVMLRGNVIASGTARALITNTLVLDDFNIKGFFIPNASFSEAEDYVRPGLEIDGGKFARVIEGAGSLASEPFSSDCSVYVVYEKLEIEDN